MSKIRFATVWLGGCSGCHMSFLDLDEWLIDLADAVDVVYSPIVDLKEFPENVDVTLVEGAIATRTTSRLIHKIRKHSKVLVSFGDCAVTGNVTAMRNPLGRKRRSRAATAPTRTRSCCARRCPHDDGIVPPLLERVMPVHEVVPVESVSCPAVRRRRRASAPCCKQCSTASRQK